MFKWFYFWATASAKSQTSARLLLMSVKLLALIIVLFLMLFDLGSVSAQGFTSGFFNFPSFSFPPKTPKPTNIPIPSPVSIPTPTASPQPVSLKPSIEDIEPSSANFMEEFVIYGNGFGETSGSISFRYYNQSFSSGGAPIVSWSDSEIVARVPAVRRGSYRIHVTAADGKKSEEERFIVKNGQPIINSTSFSNVNGEIELIFQGSEFGSRQGGVINIYDGDNIVATGIIKYWSSSRVRFELPDLARKQYGFQIQTADGRQSSLLFFSGGN